MNIKQSANEKTLDQMMEVLCALGRAYPGNRRLQVLYDEVAAMKAKKREAAIPPPSLMRDVAEVMMDAYPEKLEREDLLTISPKFGQQLWALRRRHGVDFRKREGSYWLTEDGFHAAENYLGFSPKFKDKKKRKFVPEWLYNLFNK